MDHILYQIFKVIFNITRIYTSKIKKRITFKIKARYYLELLTPEIMEVLKLR